MYDMSKQFVSQKTQHSTKYMHLSGLYAMLTKEMDKN